MIVTLVNPMQRDRELFEIFDSSQKTEHLLFFYTWDKPAITLGKAQRGRDELMAEAQSMGIDCFVRPTGGKAVCHGGDICYTFIGAQADAVYGGKLKESFQAVNEKVIDLVNEILGLDCHATNVAGNDENLSEHNCFCYQVCNEGVYADHKIVGAAQAMGKRAFIQQGSIQLNKPSFEFKSMTANVTLSELTGVDYDLELVLVKLDA